MIYDFVSDPWGFVVAIVRRINYLQPRTIRGSNNTRTLFRVFIRLNDPHVATARLIKSVGKFWSHNSKVGGKLSTPRILNHLGNKCFRLLTEPDVLQHSKS